jgi:hypothetical protein
VLLIVGGWQWRNHTEVGSWRFSAVEAKNIYLFRAAEIVAEQQGLAFEQARHELSEQLGPKPSGAEQGEYYGRMHRKGVDIVLSNPGPALRITAEGLFRIVTEARYKAFEYFRLAPASGVTALLAFLLLFVFYGVAIYGGVLAFRDRRYLLAHVFVLGIVAYVCIVSAGPEATGARAERFRAPLMPIIALYAGRGGYELLHRMRDTAR